MGSDPLTEAPLPLFLGAEAIQPALAARDWALNTARRQGRSHAVLLMAGHGLATLTQGRVHLSGPTLLWLPAGTAEKLRIEAGGGGFALSIAEDILSRAVSGARHAVELRAVADRLVHIEAPALTEALQRLGESCAGLVAEVSTLGRGGFDIVTAHMTILLTLIWRLSGLRLDVAAEGAAGSVVFQRFIQAVELHFREHWPVARYATTLGVTERRLHMACVASAGRGPLALIQARVILEACNRLEQSALPVAQIAYGLGFSDASQFNRLFRKQTGEAPGGYRRRIRALPQPDRTFAAWP